jgi:hypothetical protein
VNDQITLIAGMGAVITALAGVIAKLWIELNKRTDQLIELSKTGGSSELLEKIFQLLEAALNQTKRTKRTA